MPTVSVNLDPSQYVKVNTGFNQTILQCLGDHVRVTLSLNKPSKSNTVFHLISPSKEPLVLTSIDTNLWALATSNNSSLIATELTSSIFVGDPYIEKAVQNIFADYGDRVSVEAKNKDLIKFGRNKLVQTNRTTLMTLPTGVFNENLLTDNLITTISSDNAADVVTLSVEGHTISGGVFTFVKQDVILQGTNQVTLVTPLARCSRMYNMGSVDLVGVIYAYEDDTTTTPGVPDTGAKVHCMIDLGFNNSEKAATTISDQDYYIVTSFYADCLEKATTFGVVHLEVRYPGGVFRNIVDRSCNDTNHVYHELKPYLVVPRNSDIRIRVSSSTNSKDFSGGIQGVLAKII